MSHIKDRWFNEIVGPDGKKKRVKTALFGKGLRYRACYIDPAGAERSKSFADKMKGQAEDFLVKIENAKREYAYIDPRAGETTFSVFALTWVDSVKVDPSTREGYRSRLRHQILPFFGNYSLMKISPSLIREWEREYSKKYAPKTLEVAFAIFKAVLTAAVDDKKIPSNPTTAKSVKQPRAPHRKVVPWPRAWVTDMRSALPTRYQAMIDIAAGCGLRQGEIFGLAVEDLDLEENTLTVRRQIKRVDNRLVFGLPKSDKERIVPLPGRVLAALRDHMASFPATLSTLPWEDPTSSQTVTARLIFTNAKREAIHRPTFNKIWDCARRKVGIPKARVNGIHALRHYYASARAAAGESIKAISEDLGHEDAGFTLRTYMHLMPGTVDRTRNTIDSLYEADEAIRPDDGLATGN
jgi:integrase